MMSRMPLQEGSVNIPSPSKSSSKSPSKSPTKYERNRDHHHQVSSLALETQPTNFSTRRAATLKQDSKYDVRAQNSPNYLARRKALRQGMTTTIAKQQQKEHEQQQHQTQVEYNTPEHREWQRQWSILMTESHIFFDGIDDASIEKVKPSLAQIGSSIELFFGNNVTHVITRRSLEGVNPSDLLAKAKQRSIKIWTYDKLIRFLTNLLGHAPRHSASATTTHSNLSHMLREEKLVGPNDRDPNTKRDDYHYFKGPYLLVWDPTHHYRPFMIKEYARVDDQMSGGWPKFNSTTSGRCPFLEDPPQVVAQRQAYMEEAYVRKTERDRKRKAVAILDKNDGSARKVIVTAQEDQDQITRRMNEKYDEEDMSLQENHSMHTPLLSRAEDSNSGNIRKSVTSDQIKDGRATDQWKHGPMSTMLGRSAASVSHRFQEIVASGVNTSNFTSAVRSVAQSGEPGGAGGNGLNMVLAQVPSREVNNLKKKILDREQQTVTRTMSTPPIVKKEKESEVSKDLKPGFCENCHEKFDSFDSHVESKKHRRFANDSKQFAKLDQLLSGLQRPLKNTRYV